MVSKEKRELGGWFAWGAFLIIAFIIVLTSLSYFGIIGKTIVERKVFENSYQRSEAIKTQVDTYQAQLAGLRAQLNNPNLDPETAQQIRSQIVAIQMQLNAATNKK